MAEGVFLLDESHLGWAIGNGDPWLSTSQSETPVGPGNRSIIPSAACGAPETIEHVFFTCPFALEAWSKVPFKNEFDLSDIAQFIVGWSAIFGAISLPPTGVSDGSLAAWTLWTTRNNRIFQDKLYSEQEVVSKAIRDSKEWAEAQQKKKTGDAGRFDIVCKSEASWNQERAAAGAAWSFSHLSANLNSSDSTIFTFVKSPLVAEGSAMEQAILMDYKEISFVSDSKVLVTAIQEKTTISDLHGILLHITSMAASFNSVSWVNREFVSSVDAFAKQTLNAYVSEL